VSYRLATGYFVWDFLAWILIFAVAAAVLSVCITLVLKRQNGRFVRSGACSPAEPDIFSALDDKIYAFRKDCVEPWLDMENIHIIAVAVLFFLFSLAVFCRGAGGGAI